MGLEDDGLKQHETNHLQLHYGLSRGLILGPKVFIIMEEPYSEPYGGHVILLYMYVEHTDKQNPRNSDYHLK